MIIVQGSGDDNSTGEWRWRLVEIIIQGSGDDRDDSTGEWRWWLEDRIVQEQQGITTRYKESDLSFTDTSSHTSIRNGI